VFLVFTQMHIIISPVPLKSIIFLEYYNFFPSIQDLCFKSPHSAFVCPS
jgi:hypothetical protein